MWVIHIVVDLADLVSVTVTAIFARTAGSRATRNLSATDTLRTTTRQAFDAAFSLTMAGIGLEKVVGHSGRLGDAARHREGGVGEGLVQAGDFEDSVIRASFSLS